MSSRIAEHNRLYRRRMSVTLALAAASILILLRTTPIKSPPPERIQSIAMRGAFTVLPELDIDPDEYGNLHLTAAPVAVRSTDFIAVDIRPVSAPVVDEAATEPPAVVPERERLEALTLDDIQDAVRTTGLPLPAASDLEVLHVERPIYPRRAVELGIEGRVEIALLVDERGRVIFARPIDADRIPLLEASAMEAAYRYLFKPYLVRGAATPFWVRIPFEFSLLS